MGRKTGKYSTSTGEVSAASRHHARQVRSMKIAALKKGEGK